MNRYPIVGLHMHDDYIVLSYFVPIDQEKKFLCKIYEYIPFDYGVSKNMIIGNLSALKNHIVSFIKKYSLQKAYMIISLEGPFSIEKIIGLVTEIPQEHHIKNNDDENDLYVWDYQMIGYNQQTGKMYYYICGVPRELLFQYQLLALYADLNIIACVPQSVAILAVFNYFCAQNYQKIAITNHATLQTTLTFFQENITLEHYCTQLPTHYKKEDIITSLGLAINGMFVS